jgi:uroporphyrinogen decarboxylase
VIPKERFLKACRRESVDRPPVWMMRQAGRYLPEYRKVREEKSTLEMMKDPETACAITLQPVERLGVDAAILYSDILIVPEAMGMKLDFVKDRGPVFEKPVRSSKEVSSLNEAQVPSRCPFVYQAIELTKQKLPPDFPLLGFAGAPFTVGAYMAGGDGSYDGNCLKKLAWENETTFHQLMEKVTAATIDYLSGQVAAGVDAVQLFDTWAGTLSPEDYATFALPYEREILNAVRETGVPTILYIKGGAHLFEKMLDSGADVLSIDWRMSLSTARLLSAGKAAIQGNLDPAELYAPAARIEEAVARMIAEWGKGPGYIINLGHGIMQDVPVAHAKAFVEAAKKYGPRTL